MGDPFSLSFCNAKLHADCIGWLLFNIFLNIKKAPVKITPLLVQRKRLSLGVVQGEILTGA